MQQKRRRNTQERAKEKDIDIDQRGFTLKTKYVDNLKLRVHDL